MMFYEEEEDCCEYGAAPGEMPVSTELALRQFAGTVAYGRQDLPAVNAFTSKAEPVRGLGWLDGLDGLPWTWLPPPHSGPGGRPSPGRLDGLRRLMAEKAGAGGVFKAAFENQGVVSRYAVKSVGPSLKWGGAVVCLTARRNAPDLPCSKARSLADPGATSARCLAITANGKRLPGVLCGYADGGSAVWLYFGPHRRKWDAALGINESVAGLMTALFGEG